MTRSARVAAAAALCALALTGTATVTAPPAAADGPSNVVLLAHGGLGNSLSFATMVLDLRLHGYRPYTVDCPLPAIDTRKDADLIAARVRQIKAETGASRVHLVGHSMGGLAARWYMTQYRDPKTGKRGLSEVATYTAIGTPQRGYPPGCRTVPDQCADGPVLTALNAGDDTPGPNFYTSIGSLDQPEEADHSFDTRLDGGACLRLVRGGPHPIEPGNPTIQRAVRDALRERCPG